MKVNKQLDKEMKMERGEGEVDRYNIEMTPKFKNIFKNMRQIFFFRLGYFLFLDSYSNYMKPKYTPLKQKHKLCDNVVSKDLSLPWSFLTKDLFTF